MVQGAALGLRARGGGAGAGEGAAPMTVLLDEEEQEAIVRELEVASRGQARLWGLVLAGGCAVGAGFHLWAASSQLRAPRGLRWHAEAAVPALGGSGVVLTEIATATALAAAARAALLSAERGGEARPGDLTWALWAGRAGFALMVLWLGVGLLGGQGLTAELAVLTLGPGFATATAWSVLSFQDTTARIRALEGLKYRHKKP